MIPPSGEQFELARGMQRAVVVEVGGGLRSYGDVLLGYDIDELCSAGRGQVLAPWPNRLAGGTYEFDGATYQLALSEPKSGSAIHGLVRWASWEAVEREESRVVMEHVLHPQPVNRHLRQGLRHIELQGYVGPLRQHVEDRSQLLDNLEHLSA